MSEKKNDGGHAFPIQWRAKYIDREVVEESLGMTLRDKFADSALKTMDIPVGYEDAVDDMRKNIARACYAMADAMIAEREKPS